MGVKKGGKVCNGYKLHIKVDAESKCVVKVITTPANVSDIEMMEPLVDENDRICRGGGEKKNRRESEGERRRDRHTDPRESVKRASIE